LKKAKNFKELETLEAASEELKTSPDKMIKRLKDKIPGNCSDGSQELFAKSIGNDSSEIVPYLPPIRKYSCLKYE
jgi:hypothetical protein